MNGSAVVATPLLSFSLLLLLPARALSQEELADQPRPLYGLDGELETTAGRSENAPLPDVHVVKKGETLWGISGTHFQDPWRWPRVWAQNPQITNPHWIFPGQKLKLRADPPGAGTPTASSAADDDADGTPASPGPGGRDGAQRDGEAGALRQVGFVDAKELAIAGTINGSREEKIMLATGDQAYVEFSRARPLQRGQRYTIYQVDLDSPVKDPGSSHTLGYLARIYGDLTIDTITDRPIASATLQSLVQPVERGYRVGPLFRQFKTVAPQPNPTTMTARVVGAVQPNILIAQNMFVILNRGRRHGVELGNRFLVVRQGDGYRRQMEDWTTSDHRFPPDVVGELLAVDVRDEASVAWVSRGNREIRVGDLADMRKGY
jgi:hypothetical protein